MYKTAANKSRPETWVAIALYAHATDQVERCEEYLNKALIICPTHAMAHMGKSQRRFCALHLFFTTLPVSAAPLYSARASSHEDAGWAAIRHPIPQKGDKDYAYCVAHAHECRTHASQRNTHISHNRPSNWTGRTYASCKSLQMLTSKPVSSSSPCLLPRRPCKR